MDFKYFNKWTTPTLRRSWIRFLKLFNKAFPNGVFKSLSFLRQWLFLIVWYLYFFCINIAQPFQVDQSITNFLKLVKFFMADIEVFGKLKHALWLLSSFHKILKAYSGNCSSELCGPETNFFLSGRLLNLWLQIVVTFYRRFAEDFDNFSYFFDIFFDLWNDIKTILLFFITFLFIRFFLRSIFSVTFVIGCSITSTTTIAILITICLGISVWSTSQTLRWMACARQKKCNGSVSRPNFIIVDALFVIVVTMLSLRDSAYLWSLSCTSSIARSVTILSFTRIKPRDWSPTGKCKLKLINLRLRVDVELSKLIEKRLLVSLISQIFVTILLWISANCCMNTFFT